MPSSRIIRPAAYAPYRQVYDRTMFRAFQSEHRAGGGIGATMTHAVQDAFDVVGPAVPQMAFVHALGPTRHCAIEVGGQARIASDLDTSLICYPADMAQRTEVSDPHAVRFLALPAARVAALLAEDGSGMEALAPFGAGPFPDGRRCRC